MTHSLILSCPVETKYIGLTVTHFLYIHSLNRQCVLYEENLNYAVSFFISFWLKMDIYL